MAKKFIVATSSTPIEYKVVSEPPKAEPKGSAGAARTPNVLVLKAESDDDITVTKFTLTEEEA